MISTVIFLVGLVIAAFVAFTTRDAMHNVEKDRWGDDKETLNMRWLFKPLGILVGGLLISIFQPFALDRVDAGHVGIKVNLTGDNRGVSSYEYKTGWVMYNTWTEQMLEFPTFQQHIEYKDQQVITKGGFASTIKPSFNYSLKPNAIGDMFENLRLDIKQIEQGWLMNAIVSSVNDVANKWEVDAIFNKREEFEAAIVTECNKRLSKWFTVSQLRTNIIPPASLQKAIEGKTKAVQEAQAAQQRTLVAEAEAKEKIAIAKGDSAKVIIDAQALALAMKLKQKEITPLYVEYLKAQSWNGVLPSTVAGGSGTFLNIK
ncbi:Band 7 domain containing protein [uncultured Caudovirales phage]|uniref:Band 7 domain containing protein n=1 Tax=uncultured Caudovirales phage TaxID=2100421 RepID=A0A6J5PSH2_9CAUD|nr:Band 7 domain containing protein [uncultured Caudovirales phage]